MQQTKFYSPQLELDDALKVQAL